MENPIADCGHPLAFATRSGMRPGLLQGWQGQAVYRVETRMLSGHQKEAIVTEGDGGASWRLVSDEGAHLKGQDMAPFPLGFFTAGIMGDVLARLAAFAAAGGRSVQEVSAMMRNYYWFEGSFAKGTGQGRADPPELAVFGASGLDAELARAIEATPAMAALRQPVAATFGLNVNGHPVPVGSMAASCATDVRDPYLTHATAPTPLTDLPSDPIRKLGLVQDGEVEPFPDTVDGRLLRRVAGRATYRAAGGVETDTCLDLPGMSHFALISDDRPDGAIAPSGLAYFSAGIAFCFMTQLSRYMGAMGLDTGHLRLVQTCGFEVNAAGRGIAHPFDTHLFFNGRADAETHEMLLRIAARTCYLHAALSTPLDTQVTLS